jgi:hypothetical protein
MTDGPLGDDGIYDRRLIRTPVRTHLTAHAGGGNKTPTRRRKKND